MVVTAHHKKQTHTKSYILVILTDIKVKFDAVVAESHPQCNITVLNQMVHYDTFLVYLKGYKSSVSQQKWILLCIPSRSAWPVIFTQSEERAQFNILVFVKRANSLSEEMFMSVNKKSCLNLKMPRCSHERTTRTFYVYKNGALQHMDCMKNMVLYTLKV